MQKARTAAQDIFMVSRPDTILCGSDKNEIHHNASSVENQPSLKKNPGNNCFHNPKKFHYAIKKEKNKLRYHCLEDAKRRLKETERNKFKYVNFLEMIFNVSGRQKKSEARERDMNLFGQIILDTLNLAVMKCGYMTNTNVFIPWSIKTICKKYKDEEGRDLDIRRMYRSLKEYKRCNYIDVNEIRKEIELPSGEIVHRTIDVEIKVAEKLFRDLNMYDKFLEDRGKALEKMLKRQEAVNNKLAKLEKYKHYSAPKKGFFKELSSKLNPNRTQTQVSKEAKNSSCEQPRKAYNVAPTAAQNPRVLTLAKQIKEQHPNISIAEAISIASQKIQLYES